MNLEQIALHPSTQEALQRFFQTANLKQQQQQHDKKKTCLVFKIMSIFSGALISAFAISVFFNW